jgi:hypothetical protein
MNAKPRAVECGALESWIAEAFAQIAEARGSEVGAPYSILFDRSDKAHEPSAGADLAVLGANRALQDVERFLDRTEAWLHGRPDALELLERLRDRFAPAEPPAGEDDPRPNDAAVEGDSGSAEASALQQPPEDAAPDRSPLLPAEDPT